MELQDLWINNNELAEWADVELLRRHAQLTTVYLEGYDHG